MNNYIDEIWKDIEGYKGYYKVSNMGRVKSVEKLVKNSRNSSFKVWKEKMVKYKATVNSYGGVGLSKDGVVKRFRVHRLVALAFIPNPENKPEVNHIGKNSSGVIDKSDNRSVSLMWVTSKENIQHAWGNGLMENSRKSSKLSRGNSKCCKKVIDTSTGIIYNCAKDAADFIGVNHNMLYRYLTGRDKNPTAMKYINSDVGINEKIRSVCKIVLNTNNGIFYDSVKEAAEINNINYNTLHSYLNGVNKNKTSLILV